MVKNKLVPLQITVLQLSALLKQADSSKRKLTLTRLASAPVPFTVLSLTGNPCKEDYLAVCGLKVTVMIQDWYLELWILVTFSLLFLAPLSLLAVDVKLKNHWNSKEIFL